MLDLLKSTFFFRLLAVLAGVIILSGAFAMGVNVGERKAQHFSGWYENYNHMFGLNQDPRNAPRLAMPPLPGGHGVFGKILSISGSSLVVQGQDAVEQNVLIATSTMIRIGKGQGALKDLHPDLEVAIFGAPNTHGQIEARLIRLVNKP